MSKKSATAKKGKGGGLFNREKNNKTDKIDKWYMFMDKDIKISEQFLGDKDDDYIKLEQLSLLNNNSGTLEEVIATKINNYLYNIKSNILDPNKFYENKYKLSVNDAYKIYEQKYNLANEILQYYEKELPKMMNPFTITGKKKIL